jgi:hypothetical protein
MQYFSQLLNEDIKILKSFANKAGVSLEKVEEYWKEAKASVKKTHPELSEKDDRFWEIVNTIVQKRLKI